MLWHPESTRWVKPPFNSKICHIMRFYVAGNRTKFNLYVTIQAKKPFPALAEYITAMKSDDHSNSGAQEMLPNGA